MYKLIISRENVSMLVKCFTETGGIAVWDTLYLSEPGDAWITKIGAKKPSWKSASEPTQLITDPEDIGIVEYEEVKRFRVAVRPAQFSTKLTDAASARVRKAVEAAGDGATYRFDYETQEAVILVPIPFASLADFMEKTND